MSMTKLEEATLTWDQLSRVVDTVNFSHELLAHWRDRKRELEAAEKEPVCVRTRLSASVLAQAGTGRAETPNGQEGTDLHRRMDALGDWAHLEVEKLENALLRSNAKIEELDRACKALCKDFRAHGHLGSGDVGKCFHP